MEGLTFGATARLWLLLAPLLLAGGYWLAQQGRHKYVARFTNIDLVDSVLPHSPGWRRHVPPIALLVALTIMVLGLAHPTRLHRVPRRDGVVVLGVDVSPSMMATDVTPNREEAARRAVRAALSTIPASIEVGLVSFAATGAVEVPPTRDRDAIRGALDRLQFRSETSLADAISTSLATIGSAQPAAAGVILLSDGGNTVGPPIDVAVAQARRDHVPVSTVVVGTRRGSVTLSGKTLPVPVDAGDLQRIASQTGGRTFQAATASRLETIYRTLGRSVGTDQRRQDIISWFLTGGFVLVMIAAALSLFWFSRIP
jgi:Ca-activated chloride channel homolog